MLPKMPQARVVRTRIAIAGVLFSALVVVGLVLLTRAAVAQLAPTDTKPSNSDRIDALEALVDRPIQNLDRPDQVARTLADSRGDEPRRPHLYQSGAAAAGREASVPAPVLTGIQIDGDLSDWPAAMPRYTIGTLLTGVDQIGTGGLEDVDLSTSPDLSASFSVGYDPKKQLIYLAVIVRDDELIVENNSWLDTDACEVYVDGLHSDAHIPLPDGWPESANVSQLPVQQYIATPGPVQVYGFKKYDTNPILMGGDLKKTKTRMAFQRKHDVTTYEWAIQVFDQYPDVPTVLSPGKRIGFDVAVADKDTPAVAPGAFNEPEEARLAWIYWGPQWHFLKVLDAGNLGELVLGK